MKRIIKIKTYYSEIVVEELWSSFIINDVSDFLTRNHISVETPAHILIENVLLKELEATISSTLRNVLINDYPEPSIKELQKHSTRFEKIVLDGKTFKVDYRTSEKGRTIYAVYQLLKFIRRARQDGNSIIIEGSNR